MTNTLDVSHSLLSLSADLFWSMAQDGQCLQIFNYAAKTERAARAIQVSALDALVQPDERQQWCKTLASHQPFRQIAVRILTSGRPCDLQITGTPVFNSDLTLSHYLCVAVDLSDASAVNANLQRFRAAMDTSLDMIFLVDRETLSFTDVNNTACLELGMSRQEMLKAGPSKILDSSEQELIQRYDRLIFEGQSSRIERVMTRPDGEERALEVYSRATQIDGRWVIIGVARDITDRKRAENRALHLQRMFSALSLTNEAILRAESEQSLFQDVCTAAVSSGLFTITSILSPLPSGRFKAIANAGNYTRQPEKILVTTTPDIPEGRGLTSEAWRQHKAMLSNHFKTDERTRPWHDLAEQFDIGSAAAYPLFKRKQCVAVMLFYARPVNMFDPETQSILQSMADNISFALDNFAADEEQARAAEAIRRNEERFRSLVHLTSDYYWEMDARLKVQQYEGRIEDELNREAVQMLIGNRMWDLPGVEPDSGTWRRFKSLLRKKKAFRDIDLSFTNSAGRVYYFTLAGEPIFDNERFAGYRGIARDITERKQASNRIKHLATHDMLTGLPNRVMFQELLRSTIRTANRYKDHRFAVLFIDLDRFKNVNDTFGHNTGDQLLAAVANRLKEPLRESDIVARLGGDEFVVLLNRVSERDKALHIAENILKTFSQPIKMDDREFLIGGSIGISLFGEDARNEEEVMNHADTAMYAAKETGRNNVQCYSARLHQHSQERANLAVQLRHALANGQLSLYYQAKLSIDEGRVVGVEALMRWHHPELGEISPAQFIPIAEDNGMIVPLGEWALETALQQLSEWDALGLPPLHMAVNLSARQFNSPDLRKQIKSALTNSGIAAHRLELEITESLVVQNPDTSIALMKKIQGMGVRFALDDFGTGYSSLGQLRHYPIDTLKIDRAFVRDLAISREDQAISKAIISMGKTLGLTVVAEGVENVDQLNFLRSYQCDHTQGFYCHRPAPAGQFVSWYRQHLSMQHSPCSE
ncbi:bifunctional diguanylate cyclase/phosphodiesterase [Pseudohongiella spirulinae]|uniref:cyclic-guanylate-specific phosphodiesterase n=1 Tax=Pseudohongiella spirulinae TaxID=1249552 RepID=A0A0S2KDX9_9GAMM|nr:EAL domain-containing protein [Pseudohongiella spirulinae]ALO46441.1 PAS-PAS-GGDEF-EAL domain protein [Pseudohongiella spirulinae]